MKNKSIRIAAIVVGVLIILLALAWALATTSGAAQVREATAAFVRDGAPTKADEVIPPPVADADNAAILYNALILRLKAESPIDDASGDDAFSLAQELAGKLLDGEASPDEANQLAQQLATDTFKAAFEDLAQAAARPAYRQDLDYTNGAAILLPHLTDLRSLNRILVGAAILAAENGDAETAWNHLITSARLANHGADEPILISQLVRVANVSIFCDGMQAVAPEVLPSLEQIATIEHELAKLDTMDAYALALNGERILLGEWAFNLGGKRLADLEGMANGEARALNAYSKFAPIFHRDHAAYLRYMYAHQARADLPFSPDDLKVSDRFITGLPRIYVLTGMLAPALGKLKAKFVESQAKVRLAGVYLGILRAKKQGIAIPSEFNELEVAGDTTDPFTGDPLQYKVNDQVVTVRSLGQNQVEDRKAKNGDDIVWRFSATK